MKKSRSASGISPSSRAGESSILEGDRFYGLCFLVSTRIGRPM